METKPIVSLLRTDPFIPFRINTIQGEHYLIRRRTQLKVVAGGILYYAAPPIDPDTTAASITTFPASDVVSIDVNHAM